MNNASQHFSEVRLVTLGVSSLDAAQRFYASALGYCCLDRGRVDPELASAWRFRPELSVDYAIMAADDSGRNALRLIAASEPGQRHWRRDNRLTRTGCFALNFRCRDIHARLERIRAAGGCASDEPHFWEVSDEVHVLDSMSTDPDGIHIDLFSYVRGGELRGVLDTDVSALQTVALMVADVERSRAFYRHLGFADLFDRVLDFPGLQTMLDMDQPVRIRNVNLIKNGTIVPGRVEMFAYLDTGLPAPRPMTELACAPNLGILSFALEVDDLYTALKLIRQGGAQSPLRAGPCDVPGFGRAVSATVVGPDGEVIELVEKTVGEEVCDEL